MKHLFFVFVAWMIFATSCSETENVCDQGSGNITVSFSQEPLSRAFFDNTAQAEPWEKQINSAFIIVFDPNGNVIYRRVLTPSEITIGQMTFSLPQDVFGKECSFYTVANLIWNLDIPNRDYLTRLLDTQIATYNGTAEEVMSGCKREGGFIMTGKTVKAIAPYGSTTHVSLMLKRNVAKIAFRYTLGDEFYQAFKGSSVRIDKVTIGKTYQDIMMFEEAGYYSKGNAYSHTQEPLDNGALFYVNAIASREKEADYAVILLDGVFDADGDFSTTHDQTRVQYQTSIEGSGKGEIKRNGYYRIETAIKGISGQDALALLVASDWEAPYTQFTGVGQ